MNPIRWIDEFIKRESDIDSRGSELKVEGFFFVLIVVFVAERLLLVAKQGGPWDATSWAEVVFTPICLLCQIITRRKRLTAGLFLSLTLLRIVLTFPDPANHTYLQAILFSLFVIYDARIPEERAWLLGASKWLLLVVLFYSGLQKLLYGYYAHGEYFAYTISRYSHFRSFFTLVLPAAEIERLASYHNIPGEGPYQLHSIVGVILSRGSYTAELVLPFLLIERRTRMIGVVGSVLLIAFIESAAREFSFGLQFVNLTLLFVPGAPNFRLRWVFAAAGLLLVAIPALHLAGVIPEVMLR